ncbi:hypothetical protein KFL_001990015 [Klebsormidium nitens]|uniref:Uncharacterized protein n=1 Tax=Klebsormidium nitens TaxID=105231 RepID=A0A1Y1I7F6_KLENI|nr:hypothetical protein KFL_001990015 [Klebsormidium nitens]|eukprot:GAQ84647.1 hypothetical protein KFL_001990015 [Klebsormidium nitens]
MPATTRVSGMAPVMTLALAVPTGPLSPQTTTVNASTSFALNTVGSFIVTARDTKGLVRSQELDAPRFSVTADHGITGASFADRWDGTYGCQFVPTETARYVFTVYIDQAPFASFQADVIANSGDAAKFFVQGGVTGTVGQPVPFAVGPTTSDYKAVNSFALASNPVVTALTVPPGAPAPFVSSNCANTTRTNPGCSFGFAPTIAGQYDVSVTLGPNQVSKSPLRVSVAPGPPSANLSVITAPPGPVPVGQNCTFAVSLVDAFGNPTQGLIMSTVLVPTAGASTGGGKFEVTANEPNPSPLSFLQSSSYASQYTVTAIGVTARGDYFLRVLLRSASSAGPGSLLTQASVDSPVFTVQGGIPDARRIAAGLQGNALLDSTAGDNLTLAASVFDSYNNFLTQSDVSGASVTLTLSQGGKPVVSQALTWTGPRLVANPFVLTGAGTDAYGNPTSSAVSPEKLFVNSCLQRKVTGGTLCTGIYSVQSSASPGLYTISYLLNDAARYSVILYVNSVAAPNIPGYFIVSPGDAAAVTLSGAGTSGGTVGASRDIYIVVKDKYNNIRTGGNATLDQLAVSITLTTGKVIKLVQNVPFQGPTFDPVNGRYVVNYSATAVGLLSINVLIGGTGGRTLILPIAGGPTSAALSRLGGTGLAGSVANVTSDVIITAVDQLGFVKTTGGDPFSVRLLDTSCPPDQCSAYVSDNADGTYALRYKFAQPGTYRMDVTLSGQAVGSGTNVSSPVTLTILSASASRPIDLLKTSVSGDGLAGTVAGALASFLVTTYDSSAIRLFQGGAVFKLQMTPSVSNRVQSAPKTAVTDNNNGTYTISYSTAGAGTYAMSLFGGTTGNTSIPALSGATVTVLPGPTVAAKTTVAPFTPKSVIAGQLAQALISPADALGNLVTYTGNYPASSDQFIVQAIPGPNALGYSKNFTVTTVVNQTYLATVNVTDIVGNVQLTVLLAGKPIATGAFTVAVAAGRSVNPWVSVSGTGPWPAGTGQGIDVLPFDAFDNSIDAYKPVCTCTGYLTSANAPMVVSQCALADSSYHLWDGSETPFGYLYMMPPIKVAATYSLTVNITQTAYPGYVNTYTLPDPIVVSPGDPSAAFTKAFGPGVSSTGGQAGKNTSFTIAVKDAYNNSVPNPTGVTYKITNPTGGLIYGTLVDNEDSTLTVTYMPLATGVHKVAVFVNNAAVGNAFQVTITPPLTSAAKTTALLSGSAAPLTGGTQYAITAGKDTKLVVTAYDIYGKKQLAKSDTFTVTFTPATAVDGAATGAKCSQAVNNNDGTYTITFSANKAVSSSTPVVYSLAVTLNSGDGGPAPIAGSPFQFTVTPASVDAASSSLMTQDAFGNRGSYAPGSFYNVTGTAVTNSVKPSGSGSRRRLLQAATTSSAGSGAQFSVVNNYDGTYLITMITTQAVPYNITFRVNGVPVKSNQPGGVTFKNLVVPSGKTKKSAFTASGNGIGTATLKAGDTAQIAIQARDQYGNPTMDDLTSLAAGLTSSFQVRVGSNTSFATFSDPSSLTVSPPVTWNPVMIVVPFTVLKAGTLVTTLGFADGTILQGSPYSGTVVPGAPSAAGSLASGPGLKGALACFSGTKCVPASIYLMPQDAYGNPVMGAATAAAARATMCARFGVVFSVPASITKQAPQPDANNTARCVVTYTASAAGDQTLQVRFDGNYVVSGGQFPIAVQSGTGAADASQSTVTGDGINSVILAGQSYKLTVTLSDANGLTLQTGFGATVSASANSSALSFAFVDAQNGQFVASFKPVVSGVFVVTVSVNGKPIGGYPSGFKMKVASAATSASTSTVALLNQTLFQRNPSPETLSATGKITWFRALTPSRFT